MIKKKTKSSELITRINEALQRGRHTISPFELKSFERDARAILNVDHLDGYLAMGSVASLKGSITDTVHWHELALKCQPDNYLVLWNYATSLKALGAFSKVRLLTDRMFQMLLQAPNDSITADDIGIFVSTGRFCQSNTIKRAGEDDEIRRFLQSVELRDEDVQPHFDALEVAITQRSLAISSTAISVDESNRVIRVIFNLAASPAMCADVNWDFCEQLAEKEIPAVAVDHVSVLVLPA